MGLSFFSSLALSLVCSAALAGAESAEATFQKAASALLSQDYAAAESGFREVLRTEPNNVSALGNLGVVYSRTGRYAAAIDTYKRALRIVPGEKALLTNLGLAYVRREQFADALPIYERLASDPSNLQARELLATSELSLGRNEAAFAVLRELEVAEPSNPGVLYMTGIALTRLKQPEEAREAFGRMMSAASPAQADFLMGKASYETARFPEAAEYFRKALAADSSIEGIHRELGKTLISLHDDENAERELRLAGPNDGEALYYLGGLLALSRPADALAPLKRAHELNPDFWGPVYYLGRVYAAQGRLQEAIPLLERAARLRPEESAIQYQLAVVLRKAGRTAEAEAAFARVKNLKSQSVQREVDLLSHAPLSLPASGDKP